MNIITIDGIIGAGKSSVLKYLKDKYNYEIKPEPVDDWKRYLERIYKYDDSYYEFQLQIYKDICLIEKYNQDLLFVERSSFFIKNTFLKLLIDNHKITYDQYIEILNLHNNKTNCEPKIMIYLDISPEDALKRIKLRNRQNEECITIEYLKKLYEIHNECFLNAEKNNLIIYKINSNDTVENIANNILNLIK